MGKTVDRSPFKDSEVETQYIPALRSYIHNDRGKKYQVVEQIDAKSFIVKRDTNKTKSDMNGFNVPQTDTVIQQK